MSRRDRLRMLSVSGRTSDGRPVVRGIFRLYETEGLPLDVILEAMESRDLVPDWVSFVREAVAAGVSFERVLSMVDPSVSDVHGPGVRDAIISRLRSLPPITWQPC